MNKRALVLLFSGAPFGFGLALSGMADPSRVAGFLDETGDWDPSLAYVMVGAISTLGSGGLVGRRGMGGRGWFVSPLPACDVDPVERRLIIGLANFGLGWGLGGFCPGPALANLATFVADRWVFVPAMLLGRGIAQVACGADE